MPRHSARHHPEHHAAWFVLAVLAVMAAGSVAHTLAIHHVTATHVGYLIDGEHALLGGATAAHYLQQYLGSTRLVTAPAKLLAGSPLPVLFAMAIYTWRYRRFQFARLRTSSLLVLIAATFIHVGLPGLPPWLASDLGLSPAVARLSSPMPWSAPTAVMPAIGAALAAALTTFAVRELGRSARWMLVYPLLVGLASIYLGQQYLISVLVGWALGIAVEIAVSRSEAPPHTSRWLRSSAATTALALIAATGFSVAVAMNQPWRPDREFAEAEMIDRTPRAYYWIGKLAFEQKDYPRAAAALERLPPAHHDGDSLLMLGVAHGMLGHDPIAFRALDAAARLAPDDPRPLYWKTRLGYLSGAASEENLLGAVHILHERWGTARAKKLAAELEKLLVAPD